MMNPLALQTTHYMENLTKIREHLAVYMGSNETNDFLRLILTKFSFIVLPMAGINMIFCFFFLKLRFLKCQLKSFRVQILQIYL